MFGFVFYKNAWKIIWNFLLFSLLQINIYDIFIYIFKYIEIILSCIIKNIRIFILILKILLFVL